MNKAVKHASVRQAQRAEADKRLRAVRIDRGSVTLRLQPYVRTPRRHVTPYTCLVGQAVTVTVDEPVDVWELWAETARFWRTWRPARRRTDASAAAAAQAWSLLERAATDLKG